MPVSVPFPARVRRVLLALLAIWLMNGFDLVLTILAHDHGLLQERNPLARVVLPWGAAAVVAYKAILVGLATGIFVHYRDRRVTELALWITVLAYVGVSMHWMRCTELYDLIVRYRGHGVLSVG